MHVAAGVDEREPPEGRHHGEGRNERGDLDVGDEKAGEAAEQATQREHDEDTEAGVHALLDELEADHGDEREEGADREVDAGVRDDEGSCRPR